MKNFPSHTVYVRAGSNLKVDIPISGKPLPKVTLSRDGVPLKATMRFNTEITAENLTINLKESIAADAGRYEITAANSSGTTKAFINIVVLDRPGPPTGPVVIRDITEDSVTLKWEPPKYDGGSQVTNYIVLKAKFCKRSSILYKLKPERIISIIAEAELECVDCKARDAVTKNCVLNNLNVQL